MPQTFQPHMTLLGRLLVVGLPLAAITLGALLAYGTTWSAWRTDYHVFVNQPVPFSHEHHVKGLGLDCRYCHTSVEESPFAGLPPTKTCMTCHSQIWRDSPMLAPVRDSWASRTPIQWARVHDLPGYAYFDHSIHVAKGVGCVTCHGQVDGMPLMRRAATLQMRWCLDCHRAPEQYLRPREEVFNLHYQPPDDQPAFGRKLADEYHLRSAAELTNCSTCHR